MAIDVGYKVNRPTVYTQAQVTEDNLTEWPAFITSIDAGVNPSVVDGGVEWGYGSYRAEPGRWVVHSTYGWTIIQEPLGESSGYQDAPGAVCNFQLST